MFKKVEENISMLNRHKKAKRPKLKRWKIQCLRWKICYNAVINRLNLEKYIFVYQKTQKYNIQSKQRNWLEKRKKKKKQWIMNNLKWLNTHVFGVPNTGSQKEQKTFWRNNGWSFSKLNENTDPKSTINPMKEKYEENYTKEHHNQIDRNQWEKY